MTGIRSFVAVNDRDPIFWREYGEPNLYFRYLAFYFISDADDNWIVLKRISDESIISKPSAMSDTVWWQWKDFDALTAYEIYALLRLRQEVFIIEQHCLFSDIDGRDQQAFHLSGWNMRDRSLVAYLRVLPPSEQFQECSIGRVVTSPTVRRSGIGRMLMLEGLRRVEALYPHQTIKISAQQHLEEFYRDFGFTTVSTPYQEDGISHLAMLKPGQ